MKAISYRGASLAAGVCVLAGLNACEKPPAAPSPPGGANTVTITAAGLSPKSVQVTPGSRVLFINNDNQPHYIHSNPHPEATDCPELNQIGILNPGGRRETGNLVAPATCGYHDHDAPSNATFQGTVTVR